MDIFSNLSIDRSSPIPIYYQLSNQIITLINSGELVPEDRLPSENEFAALFGIVPMTVRQAMNELVKGGYINRIRGRGTFVAPRALEHNLDRMVSFSEDMRNRNLTPGSKILAFESLPAPSNVANALNIDEGTLVLHIKRVRLANDKPVGLHNSYLHGVQLTQEELEEEGSLYSLLEQKEVYLAESDDEIDAITADKELSEILHVPHGVPLLRVTRISRNSSGKAVEFVKAIYRADFYRYYAHLKR